MGTEETIYREKIRLDIFLKDENRIRPSKPARGAITCMEIRQTGIDKQAEVDLPAYICQLTRRATSSA